MAGDVVDVVVAARCLLAVEVPAQNHRAMLRLLRNAPIDAILLIPRPVDCIRPACGQSLVLFPRTQKMPRESRRRFCGVGGSRDLVGVKVAPMGS